MSRSSLLLLLLLSLLPLLLETREAEDAAQGSCVCLLIRNEHGGGTQFGNSTTAHVAVHCAVRHVATVMASETRGEEVTTYNGEAMVRCVILFGCW